jgi:hypothetical protein
MWVDTQHLRDQSLGLEWNGLWHMEKSSTNFREKISLILSLEWVLATQHDIQDNAQSPYISLES